jgi:hypothetical protein
MVGYYPGTLGFVNENGQNPATWVVYHLVFTYDDQVVLIVTGLQEKFRGILFVKVPVSF